MTDDDRNLMRQAARSMQARAARAARTRGVVPCHWLAEQIARDIEAMPALDEVGTSPGDDHAVP